MKNLFLSLILISCLISCNKEDNTLEQIETLKLEILTLQNEINTISNQIEGYSLQGLNYEDNTMRLKIDEFTEKRTLQTAKISTLKNEFSEVTDYETTECGDFETIECFVENWDIRKSENATVEVTSDCSYNRTTSLKLSAPFIEGEFNIPGLEIEGYINGIEAATIYKIRFWMRYSGTSDLSNGPLAYMAAIQDGEWLDYIYEGSHQTNENKVVDEDWRLYSFQIATLTNSPLEIIFGTNLDNVCIDDIHIVKKDQ